MSLSNPGHEQNRTEQKHKRKRKHKQQKKIDECRPPCFPGSIPTLLSVTYRITVTPTVRQFVLHTYIYTYVYFTSPRGFSVKYVTNTYLFSKNNMANTRISGKGYYISFSVAFLCESILSTDPIDCFSSLGATFDHKGCWVVVLCARVWVAVQERTETNAANVHVLPRCTEVKYVSHSSCPLSLTIAHMQH